MRLERRLKPQVNVDLTPLIDVILQLVIFFMITSVFRTAPGIALNLPEAGTAEPVSVSQIRIIVMSESEIFVNDNLTTITALPLVLDNQLENIEVKDTRVVLEGDAKATYDLIISVLDVLRSKGIEGIDLLTRMKMNQEDSK